MAAKERKEKGETKKRVKKEKAEIDEFDEMTSEKKLNKSLSKKLGGTPKGKKGKQKNPWSDSDASGGDLSGIVYKNYNHDILKDETLVSGSDMSDAVGHIEVKPRERAGGRRAAASKAKFKFVSLING